MSTTAPTLAASTPPVATDADVKTVTVSLPSKVHAFFSKAAAAEDRTLNNFLKRVLVKHHEDTAAGDAE